MPVIEKVDVWEQEERRRKAASFEKKSKKGKGDAIKIELRRLIPKAIEEFKKLGFLAKKMPPQKVLLNRKVGSRIHYSMYEEIYSSTHHLDD